MLKIRMREEKKLYGHTDLLWIQNIVRVFNKGWQQDDRPALRILPHAWFAHVEESSSFNEFSLKSFTRL